MAVFTFYVDAYERKQVEKFTIGECKKLAYDDEDNVLEFNDDIQTLLNNDMIDTTVNWVRVF